MSIFTTPRAGWTAWSVNGHKIGPISWISDVPSDFCFACMHYLSHHNDDLQIEGFNVHFDAEGYETGIVQIGDNFYSYDTETNDPPYINNLTLLSDGDKKDFIKMILGEAVEDFEKDFDEWVTFSTDNDKVRVEKGLDNMIKTVKEFLKSY